MYNETTVAIKIEGNERAVSHPSRNDKWLEDFDIDVEKANEVEITIYDTLAVGDSAPIGMLWLGVSDLMEAQRRQKVGIEGQGAGWVTAATAASMGPRQGSAPDSVTLHSSGTIRAPGHGGAGGSEGIDGWWSVEPAGAISLRLDFGEYNVVAVAESLSQGHRGGRTTAVRGSRSTGRRPKAQGRCVRDEWTPICSAAILSADHVCPMSGVPPHWGRLPVRRLPVCLSQKVLSQGRHEMCFEITRRWGE